MKQVQYLHSKLLDSAGIKHGWFMRSGGVSGGLFESLNGKKGTGDSNKNVDENRHRALGVLCHPELDPTSDCNKESCLRRNDNLVHIIHEFKTNILNAEKAGEYEFYDGSYTTKASALLSQTTADCASVILADTNAKVAAVVHGSWHTLNANIIYELVAKIKQIPGTGEIIAGIGPMICKNCYEFGSEAKDLFNNTYLAASGDKYLVDLKQMVIDQLELSGVTEIDDLDVCTLEDARFFSHRRSGANSGRMITLAAL